MTTEATPKMKLREIVVQEAIVPELAASQRDDVITELVDALLAGGAAKKSMREELIGLVLEREQRGSTGFGRGVAVPHVKHKDVKNLQAAIGLSRRGVDFNSLDNQPVYSVFLLLSPADKPEDHLQAMEIIFKNLSQETFRRFLRQSETIEDILHLLDEADHQKFA